MEQILEQILIHIAILNEDYTQLAVDVGVLKSQMAEMIWWFRAIAGSFIALVASQIYQINIMRKNNKK